MHPSIPGIYFGPLLKTDRDRKNGKFKLQTLARDLLGLSTTDQFHEALFDVEILEKLCNCFLKKNDFFAICKPYKQSVMIRMLLPSLKQNLKSVVSNTIIERMAGASISYKVLKQVYSEGGETGIKQLLSKKTINNKVCVTKAKKIIDIILKHLKNIN